jgi:flagellar motor protein MotB
MMRTIALVVLAGCQSLSPKSSPPVPPSVVPVPAPAAVYSSTIEESERYSSFRPIMPGQFVPPVLVQTIPVQEPPKIESPPDNAMQSRIDELNQRIAELEAQLAEAKKTPPPVIVENVPLIAEKGEVKPVKNLPIINRRDVYVASDEWQNVRIEVSDKALFVQNTWNLSPEGEETLRAIAAEIRASDPKAVLDIEGHTDSLMSDPNNLMQKHDVSSAKAMAVMNFFINALRWDAARIGTSSYGRSRPVADNGTPEGRERNNRVEIVVRDGNE